MTIKIPFVDREMIAPYRDDFWFIGNLRHIIIQYKFYIYHLLILARKVFDEYEKKEQKRPSNKVRIDILTMAIKICEDFLEQLQKDLPTNNTSMDNEQIFFDNNINQDNYMGPITRMSAQQGDYWLPSQIDKQHLLISFQLNIEKLK